MTKQERAKLREALRDRFQSIASQAVMAQRMSPLNEQLCDVVDDLDNDVQAAIDIINKLRRDGEAS